ncbi:MAG: VWA domain-containing protein [Balneolales bacterium]|nr:VWA domain-containing protein [Balneolales bacterium]
MIFANPEWLFALLLLPVLAAYHFRYIRRGREGTLSFSQVTVLQKSGNGLRAKLHVALPFIQLFALGLFIIALARPQEENVVVERETEGIDIVLVIDISSSMLAEDLRPNRFIAVKDVAQQFVRRRTNDRIGLVVFARESLTLVPPTLDHRLIHNQLDIMDIGIVRDGTAIGMGVATAVNRLRDSSAATRVIILLTDGENNSGEIDPVTSAETARTMGMRLYTIGASGEGSAPYPVDDPVFGRRYFSIPIEINEPMLTQMAEMTGGRYFRARDNRELERVYSEIDALEKTPFTENIFTDVQDRYLLFLYPGLLLFVISFLLKQSWLRAGIQ